MENKATPVKRTRSHIKAEDGIAFVKKIRMFHEAIKYLIRLKDFSDSDYHSQRKCFDNYQGRTENIFSNVNRSEFESTPGNQETAIGFIFENESFKSSTLGGLRYLYDRQSSSAHHGLISFAMLPTLREMRDEIRMDSKDCGVSGHPKVGQLLIKIQKWIHLIQLSSRDYPEEMKDKKQLEPWPMMR